MSHNSRLPQFPDSYLGENADQYNNQKWMQKNQKKTTIRCLEFLFDEKLGNEHIKPNIPYLILDLGCGTGFSSEILLKGGFRVVGVDILIDMLEKAKEKKRKFNDSFIELILADITRLPFRRDSFDHIISVSSYNFITYNASSTREIHKIINNTSKKLRKIIKNYGRVIIEFYPQSDEELDLYVKSFTSFGFDGFLVKHNPNQKAGQTFLLMEKTFNYG